MSFSGSRAASVSKKMCDSTSPLDANERDGNATATDEEPILAIAKAIPQTGTAAVQCMEVEDCLINPAKDEDSDPIYRRQSSSTITPAGYFRRSSPRVYGRHTIRMKCQFCDEEMWTRATPIIDAFSVVGAFVLVFLWWPLFWIPLLLPCFKTTIHSCTKCQKEVGWHTPYQCSS